MGGRRERSLRAMLAGSLVFWGLATVSVSAVTALTTDTAAASSTTFFSSTTPGTYTVTGLPSGIPLTITAVGGSGGADAPNGFAGGEGAIVTSTFTPTGESGESSLEVTVGAECTVAPLDSAVLAQEPGEAAPAAAKAEAEVADRRSSMGLRR